MRTERSAGSPGSTVARTIVLAALVICGQSVAQDVARPPVQADRAKILYELGVQMSGGIQTFYLSESEFKIVAAGLADGYHRRADVSAAAAYEPAMQKLRGARVAIMTQREKDAGRAQLLKLASSPGATRTSSGLVYIPGRIGTGPMPAANDQVQVSYVGRLFDGSVFDSSKERGAPSTLSLGLVMPCLSEALKRMHVGGRSRVGCPSELAYGDRGDLPKILPGAALEFDLELLSIDSRGTAAPSSELSDQMIDRD